MVKPVGGKHDYNEIPHVQRISWFLKANAEEFDVPYDNVKCSSLTVDTPQWENVNQTENMRHNFKYDAYPMRYNIDHFLQSGLPMSDMAVFNPAD